MRARTIGPRWLAAGLCCVLGIAAVAAIGRESDDPPRTSVTSEHAIINPIPLSLKTDRSRAALGEILYRDTRLSRSNDRSCQTCHDVTTNGAGASRKAEAPDGTPLARNTPTVFNAALSFRFEWDGKVPTLEQQVERALTRPEFLAASWPQILGKLRMDEALTARFRQVYGREPDREAVLDAITSYERTLLTPDSRFDAWLRGDKNALSDKERAGFELFSGIGCASCHQGVNVGGNLFQRVGIFGPLAQKRGETLRVPSLRNVAVTAPYFDDGSAATLSDAVRRMARAQLGRELTDAQIDQIVAFLATLTGSYRGRVLTAPR